MATYARLYIDFDGVICDSVREAFVCSYLIYHNLPDVASAEVATAERALFYRYRPFIRSGQHLVLLQHCIAHDIPLTTQQDFEEQLRATPADQLTAWRNALYTLRDRLIKTQLATYIQFHTLYANMRTHLAPLSRRAAVYILSTKKSHLISLLLADAGINWPTERILISHRQSKIDIIDQERHRIASETPASPTALAPVAFIDDHLPHILPITAGRARGIDCYLADWGYVLPDWQHNRDYAHLATDSLDQFLAPFK